MDFIINLAITGYDCGGADILRVLKFLFTLIDLVLFIVPIGLVVFIMIDFSKNVIASKDDEMKKNVSIVIKRILYCLVLFLVPTIANFSIKLVGNMGVEAVKKASTCIEIAKTEDLSKYEVDYDTMEPKKRELCSECSKGTDCKSGICKNGRCVEEIGYSNTFTNCE